MSKEPEPQPNAAPVVFVSYSHDTDEHKEWVRKFATSLRDYGIDVLLDQWEIGAGDDVPKFMEQSVKKALRVVMVCTEPYVRKADDGKGGAGYEVMIVTGELVADLGTKKFVPIMRQTGDPKVLPACVATRYYVDFSDDATFGEKLEELARNIHEAPKFEKPPLGKNPFLGKTPEPPPAPETVAGERSDSGASPLDIYRQARAIADAGDFAAWRDLIHRQKSDASTALLAWKEQNQRDFPAQQKDLPAYFQPAVATHAGLIAAALGAFDSKDERFHSQLALIDDLRNPKGWERSGPTVWTDLPDLIWFTYQALLGALALSRHRPEAAVGLARTKITNRYADRDTQPLFKTTWAMGWPVSMGGNCLTGWAFLHQTIEEWSWLWELYGSKEDLKAAIIAYYALLNIVDFVSAARQAMAEGKDIREPIVPLCYVRSGEELITRASTILTEFAGFLKKLLEENGLDGDSLPALWNSWLKHCGAWIGNVWRGGFWTLERNLGLPQFELPKLLDTARTHLVID